MVDWSQIYNDYTLFVWLFAAAALYLLYREFVKPWFAKRNVKNQELPLPPPLPSFARGTQYETRYAQQQPPTMSDDHYSYVFKMQEQLNTRKAELTGQITSLQSQLNEVNNRLAFYNQEIERTKLRPL